MLKMLARLAIFRHKPIAFGISLICCLPRIICLAGYQSKILYRFRAKPFTNNHSLSAESNCRHFLRMDRNILWRVGANVGYLEFSYQQYPGISLIIQ